MAQSIAMILFSIYPGDARPRREAEALVSSGFSVDLLCPRYQDEAWKETVNGVTVYRLPTKKDRGGKLSYIWQYSKFIFLSLIYLSFLYTKRRYDIVHVHNMPDILVFSALIPKIFGSRIILDLHDPMPEVFMAKYHLPESHIAISTLRFLEKVSIGFSNFVITPNISFRNLFVSRSCHSKKIGIVMNSPELSIFNHRNNILNNTKPLSGIRQFRLMYHGSIVERHGLDTLVHAIAKVKDKIPNLSFHAYGSGDFVPDFLELVEELDLKNMVFYHGFISHKAIAEAIEEIDIGIIPNKQNSFTEINFPTRIFEYLCMEKPVIAPDTQGIRDYFNNDSLNFFKPGDVSSLADVILNVYHQKPEQRAHILKAGIGIYNQYNWELQSKVLVNCVKKLLRGNC